MSGRGTAPMAPVGAGRPSSEVVGDHAGLHLHFEPPDRPTSAPPDLHSDGGPNLLAFPSEEDGIHPGAGSSFRAWTDVPERPRSAPVFDDQEHDSLGIAASCGSEEDYASGPSVGATGSSSAGAGGGGLGTAARQPILDPKGKGLFAFQPKIPSRLPPPSPSPAAPVRRGSPLAAGNSAAGDDARNNSHSAANFFGIQDHRCTPPPSLGLVPESPGGLHGTGRLSGGMHGDDCPALLHPGVVRAFEPFDRPISAPPALDPGASLLAMQANLPKSLDPSPDLIRHRTNSTSTSEFAQIATADSPGCIDAGSKIACGGFAGGAPGFSDHLGICPSAGTPAVYHGGHLPRSPSPPWDGHHGLASAAAHHAAVAHHHAAAVAQAHLRHQACVASSQSAQHLQHNAVAAAAAMGVTCGQPAMIPTGLALPVPLPLGANAGSGGVHGGYSAAAAAAAAAAALRQNPLLGAAGYPTAAFPEAGGPGAVLYAWQAALDPSLAGNPASAAAAAFTAASLSSASARGHRGQPSSGSRDVGREVSRRSNDTAGTGQTAGSIMTGSGSASSSSRPGKPGNGGSGIDASAGSSEWADLPRGDQASRQSSNAGVQGNGGERKQRGGYKISHLEEMFASNAFITNVYSIAKDQAGCRMLQHKLDENKAEATGAIFSEVLSHIVELMMDPFGNYLCQKMMDMCSGPQLQLVLDKVCGALVKISLNMHGARAVQKLIDVVRKTPHVHRLVAALEGAVVSLTKDPNGNHVVQKCLEALPVEAHAFIFHAVANAVVDVASHRHGCRIVQRCIDASSGHEKTLLVGSICRSALTLVQDPFGNYVVQYVLGLNDHQANSDVARCLLGRLGVLSKQKFSSNVVESCLRLCGPEDRLLMIRELADTRILGELLKDVFGNYVVQSALTVTPEPELSHFLGCVRPLLPSLRANGQGRRIAQKLEKKYPQLRNVGGTNANSKNTGVSTASTATSLEGGTASLNAPSIPACPSQQAFSGNPAGGNPAGGCGGCHHNACSACVPCLAPGTCNAAIFQAFSGPAPSLDAASVISPGSVAQVLPAMPPAAVAVAAMGPGQFRHCASGTAPNQPNHQQMGFFQQSQQQNHHQLSQQPQQQKTNAGSGVGSGRGRQRRGGRRKDAGGGGADSGDIAR